MCTCVQVCVHTHKALGLGVREVEGVAYGQISDALPLQAEQFAFTCLDIELLLLILFAKK